MTLQDLSDKIIYAPNGAPDKELWRFRRASTCCFTGHRTEQLPDGGDPDSEGFKKMMELSEMYVRLLIRRGFDTFITGMSRGYDLIMADLLLGGNGLGDEVNVICALPYARQFKEMRTEEDRRIYEKTLERSKAILLCSQEYFKGCYAVRNRLMVNCSSALIGYVSSRDSRSGSSQTVNMASRAGLERYVTYGEDIAQIGFSDII